MTGVVAYIGICLKRAKCLQQCANAARCATVAWVRRTTERVGTCLLKALLATVMQAPCAQHVESVRDSAMEQWYIAFILAELQADGCVPSKKQS